MHMQQEITAAIQKALAVLDLPKVSFTVERPAELLHGDYYTNVAMVVFRKLAAAVDSHADEIHWAGKWKNPHELAQHLKKELHGKIDGVEKIEVAGPGFINFYLSRDAIVSEIQKAATDASWGSNSLQRDKTVMVEYTQPNPFKPFHIGHLMSNTFGESLVRLLRNANAKVIPVNYQGDVGLHIAKAIWGLQKKGYDASDVLEIGEAYVFGNTAYEDDVDAKTEIITINKQVYAQDPAIMPLYTRGRAVTLARFEEIYAMLGTHFEHYFFESEVWKVGEQLVRDGLQKGVFEESEGAIVFRGEKAGLHTRVFITKEGLPTYDAKDLGLAMAKLAYASFDLSITVTATEQGEYFKVVFEALAELRPELRGKFIRVTHGLLKLTTGKMSSRKGNVITGESLLLDLKEAAKEKMQGRELPDADKVAEQVAVGAIKYAVLKQGSGKDIIFDPEKSLSLEGDSGPYLQYALVRARSLIKKAEEANVSDAVIDLSDIAEFVAALTLDRVLIHFPEVVEHAVQELEPHYVTTYLTELAAAFNSWYANTRVIGGEYPSYALTLARAFEHTMSRGLALLGIPAPEEM